MNEEGWRKELARLALFDKQKEWDECRLVFSDWLEENNGDYWEIRAARWKWILSSCLDVYDGDYTVGDRARDHLFLKTKVTNVVLPVYYSNSRLLHNKPFLHIPKSGMILNREYVYNNLIELWIPGSREECPRMYLDGNQLEVIAPYAVLDEHISIK